MNVAIVHYHLRRGGVTRVIENALAALAAHDVSVVLVAGEPPAEGTFEGVPVAVCPGLQYDAQRPARTERQLADELLRESERALGAPPDLWHVHNHSLGKNAAQPGAVHHLAERGDRLLLQLHDFPEDGRPATYQSLREQAERPLEEVLYPKARHVQYAAINSRDLGILQHAGADACHLLPNAVSLPGAEQAIARIKPDPGLALYPTRGIRRKNLGEFLLWSALAEEGHRFAVTLAPKNPAMQAIYRDWVDFAGQLDLPVAFEYKPGEPQSFVETLASAGVLVTTSVAEGFGLAFLEPWLAGRPLAGRNLPEITHEFEDAGVDLSSLYDTLFVPAEWLDVARYETLVHERMKESWAAYGRSMTPEAPAAALHASLRDGKVEFAKLDERLQQEVIRHVHKHPTVREALPFPGLSARLANDSTCSANREAVRSNFGLEAYGMKLHSIYRDLAATDPSGVGALDGASILDEFLAPERFTLLRTGT